MKKLDAVFEGGGVKGIGLVGAVSEIEAHKYQFENLVGTSAGAIVAALLAVGYSAVELKNIILQLDYNSFKDEGLLDKLGIIGKGLSIGFEFGIYEGDFFEKWIENLLQRRQKTTFGDIITDSQDEKYKYKLQVIAADITDRKLLVLPRDLAYFGFDPEKFSISRAVRMSMSIPIFFEPVQLTDTSGRVHYIVDGGILSNYPVWLLDDGTSDPPWPTIGFKLMEPNERKLKGSDMNPIKNPISFLKALAGTMMEAHDNYHISKSKGDYQRTIGIPTTIKQAGLSKEIKTIDFDISREDSEALFQNGVKSAKEFFKKWDFEKWKKRFRKV
jgi:NTE family protein